MFALSRWLCASGALRCEISRSDTYGCGTICVIWQLAVFRAGINGAGGPLSYDAAHHRWQGYRAAVGVEIDIHQLRHAHATELINAEVSIEAVRRRLGQAIH